MKGVRVSNKVGQVVSVHDHGTAIFADVEKVYRFVNGTMRGIVEYRNKKIKVQTIPKTKGCWETI